MRSVPHRGSEWVLRSVTHWQDPIRAANMTSLLTSFLILIMWNDTDTLLLTSYPSVPTAPGCTGTSEARLIAFRTTTGHLLNDLPDFDE
jgi:hypothetical protein